MPVRSPASLRAVAAAALLAFGASAQAAITVYDDEASFLAALGVAAQVDTFDDLTPGANLGSGPFMRMAGSVMYEVSAGPDSDVLYGAGTAGDAWISTNLASDLLTFTNFAPGVFGVGANVFGSDIAGDFLQAGLLVARATDSMGSALEFQFRPTTSTFMGFITDSGTITSFTVQSFYRSTVVWPTVNNLTVGVVPEPGTVAMLLAGLAIVGAIARRQRSE
jgi:hypothetical protein